MPRKILLVDGYNVIHKLPELRAGLAAGLEYARDKLAVLIARWNALHPEYECTVVFDGRDRSAARRTLKTGGIKCVFSESTHDADQEIVRIVKSHSRPADIVVVSDDNFVHNNCRAHGAVIRSAGFLQEAGPHPSRPPKAAPREAKGLDRRAMDKINAELRNAWAGKKGD
jgi:predicted RNA-binding protein with PIN domain